MDYITSPLKPTQLDLKKLLVLIVISILIGLSFGAVYQQLSEFMAPVWVAAAVFHTTLAFGLVGFLAQRKRLAAMFSLTADGRFPTKALYVPSALIAFAVLVAFVISSFIGGRESSTVDWASQLAFILWIPLIEELVFRAGIGATLQRYAPGLWGIWFSALIFAWVHTSPSLSGLLAGHMGLPLGPFFLGLICEYLRVAGGSLVPAVIFHMVCNSTVVAFSLYDPRWMYWLNWLYS